MGSFTISRLVGGMLLLLGLVLVLPGIASASSTSAVRPSPILDVTPSASNGRAVMVSASGLPPDRHGEIVECSSANPQPTVVVRGVPTPVSCSRPRRVRAGAEGTFASVRFKVVDGSVGPPVSGTDSWGHPAATDAARYPCPPTAVQDSVGVFCYLKLRWGSSTADQTVEPLAFAIASQHTTSPTTVPTAGSTISPHVAATMTVTPDTNLGIDRIVVVRATGLPPHGVGVIRECNSTFPQPTIEVGGVRTPVSCTDPNGRRWTFGAYGSLGAFFRTVFGTTGPPRLGTDSSGHPAAIDARQYPCSPTAAQVAAGAHCYLEIVWGAGATRRVVVPITFEVASSTVATATTTTTVPGTTTAATSAGTSKPTTTTGGSLLPFTGAAIEQMALAGLLLVLLGTGLLLVGARRTRRRHPGPPVDAP